MCANKNGDLRGKNRSTLDSRTGSEENKRYFCTKQDHAYICNKINEILKSNTLNLGKFGKQHGICQQSLKGFLQGNSVRTKLFYDLLFSAINSTIDLCPCTKVGATHYKSQYDLEFDLYARRENMRVATTPQARPASPETSKKLGDLMASMLLESNFETGCKTRLTNQELYGGRRDYYRRSKK